MGSQGDVSSQDKLSGQRNIEKFGLERTSESNLVSLLREGPAWKLKPTLKLNQVADP